MYGSTGGYGGFSIFWVVVVFIAPVVGVILNGGLPDGSTSARDMPPIVFVGGGLAIAILVGSKLLQERVRRQDEAGPQPTRIDALAQQLLLLPETDLATKRPKLTGRRGQVWLAVHLEKKAIRIQARHNLSLPAGFSITNTNTAPHKPLRAAEGGVVLSRALRFVGSESVAIPWDHPEVAGALMAVLHPYPGSSIDNQRITLSGIGMKEADIAGHIDEIMRLVAVLKEPPSQDLAAPKFPGR